MSYFDYPRLHFSGLYQAAPSTINNTPNNYNPNNDQEKLLELYWNPMGTGIFDFKDVVVTKVEYSPTESTTDPKADPIIGQPVAAVYAKAAPKIVDLDPMQQNVSEIWGMTLQVAGTTIAPTSIKNFVRGDFAGVSFNGIWFQAKDGPGSSASGSACYQSSLSNLAWDTTEGARSSRFISELNAAAAEKLSINFAVNAHNNAPPVYAFNSATFATMKSQGIPDDVVARLAPLGCLQQNAYQKKEGDCQGGAAGSNRGDIPTEAYVNFQLNQLLGQADASQYGAEIKKITLQEYTPSTQNDFLFGQTVGTIGPSAADSPTCYVSSRVMAPAADLNNPNTWYAPFKVSGSSISVNLSNSLATNKPGEAFSEKRLGKLELVYFDTSNGGDISVSSAQAIAEIDYLPTTFMTQDGGIFAANLADGVPDKIANLPVGILSTPPGATPLVLMAEQIDGYSLRADEFVYRMNPGVESSPGQNRGATAEVSIHVNKFGLPVANETISLVKKTPSQAAQYTVNTLGTSGTLSISNVSVPESALVIEAQTVTTDANGVASFSLKSTNPGNPRSYVDGQVYFLDYTFANEKAGLMQDPNDIVSVQVYQEDQMAGPLTWNGGIRDILGMYGKLYPIMSQFELWDYASVVKNKQKILTVLTKPFDDPLYMPVIRDLSESKLKLVVDWLGEENPAL